MGRLLDILFADEEPQETEGGGGGSLLDIYLAGKATPELEPITFKEMLTGAFTPESIEANRPMERPFDLSTLQWRDPDSPVAPYNQFGTNVVSDITAIMSPRNWAMGIGAMGGAITKDIVSGLGQLGVDTGTPLEEGEWIDAAGNNRTDTPHDLIDSACYYFWNAPTTLELGQELIRPYTSMENFKGYAFEHPVMLALDASIIASLGKAGFRAGVGAASRRATATHTARATRFSSAMRAGATAEELTLLAEQQRGAHVNAQNWMRRAEGAGLQAPGPSTTISYDRPPALSTTPLEIAQRAVQRSPAQTWLDKTVHWWMNGQAKLYTMQDLNELGTATRGLTPEIYPRFYNEFLPLTQIGHNEAVLTRAVRAGDILPQTANSLRAWRNITNRRVARWSEMGKLTPEQARARALLPARELGIASDIRTRRLGTRAHREAMVEWDRAVEDWAITNESSSSLFHGSAPKPPNPLSLDDTLKLITEQPELFNADNAGRWVDPVYYPHAQAQNIAMGAARDAAGNLIRYPRPGFLKHATGVSFREGVYNQAVMEALPRNIRACNAYEGIYRTLKDITNSYGVKPPKGWQAGMEVPEGYRVVWPEGWQEWSSKTFEQQVIKLASKVDDIAGMGDLEQRIAIEQYLKDLTRGTDSTVRRGKPLFIPDEIAEHLKTHVAPTIPGFEVFTDFGGSTSFWRTFVLPFRSAWQVVNESTNAMLTGIAGNWAGTKLYRQPGIRRRLPGAVMNDTVLPEFGPVGGYAAPTQKWLWSLGPAGGMLNNYNRWLHNTPLMRFGRSGRTQVAGREFQTVFGAEFNQIRDNYYKASNMLGEIQQEFRRAGRAGVSLDTGPKVFTPTEITGINSSFEKMVGAIETVLEGAGKTGQNAFLQEMTARAGDAVYSWNKLSPFQRQYISRAVPFSGWQLFTTGLLFRLPVKYPGRAWLMKSVANMGRNYINDMFDNMGIDPDTIPEWDNNTIPLFVDAESGKVVTMRWSAFRLYDHMGIDDIGSTILSHPDARMWMETLFGGHLFPEFEPLSKPPMQWGEETEAGRRNGFDIIAERMFGPYYNFANQLAHPYVQYDVGGLTSPEEVLIEGQQVKKDWRSALLQMTLGMSIQERDPYQMRERVYRDARSGTDGAFLELSNLALVGYDRDTSELNVSEQITRHPQIRAVTETYLQRGYQMIEMMDVMLDMAEGKDANNLNRDYTRYVNQIKRVEEMLHYMIANPGKYISPEMIHGDTWINPYEVEE
ncbi:MAG: hypothetical protein KAU50_12575 [Candidatus Marinimicrobia bacterium]|nr:hypothetical protein [Candidatus Neomarinimicrobiota bacterium]